jgi:ABC-type sugar transport system permease subunit
LNDPIRKETGWLASLRGENRVLLLCLLPALILVIVFQFIPSVQTIWYSLTDVALLGKKALKWDFLGLANYTRLVSDRYFWKSVAITMRYVAISLVFRFAIGLISALFLSSKMKGRTVISLFLLLPMAIPGVMHAYVWISMLEPRAGTINSVLRWIGLPPQSWTYGRITESLIMINTWAGYVLPMLIMASALVSIPKEYHEAAEVYGASAWMKYWKIIFPIIRLPLMFCLIIIVKEDMDDFTYAYMYTGETPRADYKSELLSLYAYHRAFNYYELGYGCAVGLILALTILVLTLAQVKAGRLAK